MNYKEKLLIATLRLSNISIRKQFHNTSLNILWIYYAAYDINMYLLHIFPILNTKNPLHSKVISTFQPA